MLKTVFCAALLVFGVVCGEDSSQPPSPSAGQAERSPPEEKSATHQQDTKAEQRGSEQAPFVVKILPAPQADEKPTEAASKQPEKPTHDWTTGDIIGGIAAFAGLLQAAALVITILVLVRTSRRQLRAYVLPESGALYDGTTLNPPQPDFAGMPGVTLVFKNSGQTPAYRYISWAEISVTEPNNINNMVIPTLQFVFPTAIGAGSTNPKNFSLRRKLTDSEISDIGTATKFVFVYGRIEYRDAFRRDRWTTFRLQYSGQWPPIPGTLLHFSEEGNDSN